MKIGVRTSASSHSKLPLILGMLLVTTLLLLVVFSLNPPEGHRHPRSAQLLRDSVRAARVQHSSEEESGGVSVVDARRSAMSASTMLPDVALQQEQPRLRIDENPPPSVAAAAASPVPYHAARGGLDLETQAQTKPHASLRSQQPQPEAAAATIAFAAKAPHTARPTIQLHLTVQQSTENAPAFPLLRRLHIDAVLARRQHPAAPLHTAGEDVVETLHRALQTGSISPPAAVVASSPAREKDLKDTLEALIRLRRPKAFIEISTLPLPSSFAWSLSATFPSLLSVFIPMKRKAGAPTVSDDARRTAEQTEQHDIALAASSNLYVAKTKSEFSKPFPGMFDCLQVVEDLERLVYTQLPSEFEEMLGRVMCRCNATFVPKELPKTAYFSFWESTTALLLASVVAALDICTIRFDTSSDYGKVRYSQIVATRNDNSTALSTPSGHISAADLVKLGLSSTTLHHFGAAINDQCTVFGRCGELPATLSALVMSGSVLGDSASGVQLISTMRRLRLIHAIAGDDGVDKNAATRASPVAPPSSLSLNRSSTFSKPASSLRRRLYSYAEVVKKSADAANAPAHAQSTWELLDFASGPSAALYKSALRQFNEVQTAPNDTSSEAPAKVSGISREARLRQRSMQEREEAPYRKWAKLAHEEGIFARDGSPAPAGAMSIYVVGRHITMLSSKIAQSLRAFGSSDPGLVFSLHTDGLAVLPHRELLDLLGVRNTLLGHRQLSAELLAALLGAPEKADLAIFQSDVVLRLLAVALGGGNAASDGCGVGLFEEMLAATLSLAQTSYIELPSRESFLEMVRLAAPSCAVVYEDRYEDAGRARAAGAAASSSGAPSFGTAILRAACARLPPGLVVAVQEKEFSSQAGSKAADAANSAADAANSASTLAEATPAHAASASLLFKIALSGGTWSSRAVAGRGISIYSLLHLGVDASQKRELLQLYMELPLWSLSQAEAAAVSPWTVFARPFKSSPHAWALWHHSPHDASSLQAPGNPPRSPPLLTAAAGDLVRSTHGARVGVSQGRGDFISERARAKFLFQVLSQEFERNPAEMAEGKFSFVEHGSGYGFLSTLLAGTYPNATVVSLEADAHKV